MKEIVENYATTCKKFAHDTKRLENLSNEYWYTTTSDMNWAQTADNAHHGFDVSWAFHQTDEFIEDHAAEKLIAHFSPNYMLALNIATA